MKHPEDGSPMSFLKKGQLITAVDELSRMYKITLSVQRLIEESRVPEDQQTVEWSRNRAKLQQHIENLCAAKVSPHLETLGVLLRKLIDNMRPTDEWKPGGRKR